LPWFLLAACLILLRVTPSGWLWELRASRRRCAAPHWASGTAVAAPMPFSRRWPSATTSPLG